MELPHSILEVVGLSRDILRCCMLSAGEPLDCQRVGAATSSSARVLGAAERSSAAVPAGEAGDALPIVRYPQGTDNACVVCSAASALWYLGHAAAAQRVARLKPTLLALSASQNRIRWATDQCRNQLRPGWTPRRLPADFDPLTAFADVDVPTVAVMQVLMEPAALPFPAC